WITHADVARVLDPLPVGRMWTVGRVAAAKLERYDIRTIGELARAPVALLTRLFGTHGAELSRLAHGEDDRPVVPDRDEKSIGGEHTFEQDLTTLSEAESWLMRLAEKVGERTRAANVAGRTITVKLRVPPFETMSRRVTLARATASTDAIYAEARVLLARWWHERGEPRLRLLGVTVSGLEAASTALPAALPPTARRPDDATLDRINERFGRGAIRRATALAADDEPEGVAGPRTALREHKRKPS
ncbi:MAG TPA: DNA polymerase IV, partial [Candidatus Saccharimonadia bacterium]|nr:DNA polymerase IV [Candidatus Saccharimonadia bacterium]